MLRPSRRLRAGAAGVVAVLAAIGCTARDREDSGSIHRYSVRGEIVRLPDPTRPDGSDIYLRHEAIPDFVDADGEAVGMEAMTMPFPIAAGVELGGLAVGDPVAFDLEVRWEGLPPAQITRIEKVAAEPPGEPGDLPGEEDTHGPAQLDAPAAEPEEHDGHH